MVKLKCRFSWQAQYLVKLKCHFSWQVQFTWWSSSVTFRGRGSIFGDVQMLPFVVGAVFGEGQVLLFVAGAALGECLNVRLGSKRCILQ